MAGMTHRDSHVIGRYFHDLSHLKPLRPDEEVRLARLIREGDRTALNHLVSANLRFVITVAKPYQHRGLTLSDLIAEGNIGLIEAARNFDESKGFKFISYAVWWIRQRIFKALEDQSRVIRIPKRQSDLLTHVFVQTARLEQRLGRLPTDGELAEAAELTEARLKEILHHSACASSFDLPSEGDVFSLLEVYANPDEPADRLLKDADRPTLLHQALSQLNERERKVILLSFGLDTDREHNDTEIGERLGISSQLVQLARQKALRKLKTCPAVHLLAS